MPRPSNHRIETEQFVLDFRPNSRGARLALLSRREALIEIQRLLRLEVEHSSLLGDWCGRFLDVSDHRAIADTDRLFWSYFGFCEALGVADVDRLTFAAFGEAMTECGFAPVEGDDKQRALRRGCRLLPRKLGMPLLDPSPDVDTFLAEQCEIDCGVRSRVRSTALHDAFCAWAKGRNARPISLKRLGTELRSRGFEKLHSNGIYWLSIRLRTRVVAETADGCLERSA